MGVEQLGFLIIRKKVCTHSFPSEEIVSVSVVGISHICGCSCQNLLLCRHHVRAYLLFMISMLQHKPCKYMYVHRHIDVEWHEYMCEYSTYILVIVECTFCSCNM